MEWSIEESALENQARSRKGRINLRPCMGRGQCRRCRFRKLANGKRKRCDIITGNHLCPEATYDKTGCHGSTNRTRLRRRRYRAGDDALAVAFAQRTTAVAEDARSLRPGRPPGSRLS